jgi:hypothetical protein
MNIETGLIVLLIVSNAITLRLLAEFKKKNEMEYDENIKLRSRIDSLNDDSYRKSVKIRHKDKIIQEQSDLIKQMEYDRDNI